MGRRSVGLGLGLGMATLYLSLIVLIPLAAVVFRSTEDGLGGFWAQVTTPEASSALKLTVVASLLVALINLVMGTLIAWVLVRDDFPGKRIVEMLIDLPFALPTIVAGLVLLALYGPSTARWASTSPTRAAASCVALLFVTLPFVVRTVQPVLLELDQEIEEAAASLGAGRVDDLPAGDPAEPAAGDAVRARRWRSPGPSASSARPCSSPATSRSRRRSPPVSIFGQIESDNLTGAAAVSTVLLVVALVMLVALDLLQRWGPVVARYGLRSRRPGLPAVPARPAGGPHLLDAPSRTASRR